MCSPIARVRWAMFADVAARQARLWPENSNRDKRAKIAFAKNISLVEAVRSSLTPGNLS